MTRRLADFIAYCVKRLQAKAHEDAVQLQAVVIQRAVDGLPDAVEVRGYYLDVEIAGSWYCARFWLTWEELTTSRYFNFREYNPREPRC